ncbi:MAG: phage baseplate assembly protein [Gammaproteobacteria bacterium]
MPELQLKVGGQIYSGWEEVRVSRGIDQLAGSFELKLSERFDGTSTLRPIRYGQSATVLADGETVMTGFIDTVAPDYDDTTHFLNVSGRDATGDLVDCAAIHKSSVWTNQSLAQIAFDLVQPFKAGLEVIADVGAPFPTWRIEPGETVFENLDRAARYRGVLLTSDGLGNLVITQPGADVAPAALVLGQNILRAQGHSSSLERFADYIVRAQQAGTDTVYGTTAASPSGEALDSAVGRYRPTVIVAEDMADQAACQTRANWQRTVAAARSQQIVYTVSTWRADGRLWQPNALVPVTDPFMGIDERRLISRVDFVLDSQGSRTELTVVPRHAYDPQHLPDPPAGGGLF